MSFKVFKLIAFLIILLSGSTPLFSFQMTKQVKVRAPEFQGGSGWLNTDKPLTLAGLKGKIVLIDFWTYGCINCIHIIPDLKKLEAKYADQLVVIGVHSAKFENEGETENIRRIILRYGIEHPVYNDSQFKTWDQYAVKAYPTQVLIDPNGYIFGTYVGEGNSKAIDSAIGSAVSEFRRMGNLNEKPLDFALERAKVGNLPLAFPGKVLADERTDRLYIADSNHNRIVVTRLDGTLVETIGSGKEGFRDGTYDAAQFSKPQGMALSDKHLFIADTENHSIRRVDLKRRTVETIAGTGSLDEFTGAGGDGRKTSLRSPWDVSLVGNYLFIAMAGSHQIWMMDVETGKIAPYAGTRAEARLDGIIENSAFAQPSGIVSDGKNLYVADSESNIIRKINFQEALVETLAGGDLWIFGDVDGEGDDVRFQHPLGIDIYRGNLLIADTYNHKIKLLDPETQFVKTIYGNGKPGQIDGKKPTFYEPGGISVAGDRLFIADTNNHAIRVINLRSDETITLKIPGLAPPAAVFDDQRPVAPNLLRINVQKTMVEPNSDVIFRTGLDLPEGFHLNPNAPQRFEISADDAVALKIAPTRGKFKQLPLDIMFNTGKAGAKKISVNLTVYYCREDNTGVCLIKTVSWQVPLDVKASKNSAKIITLSARID